MMEQENGINSKPLSVQLASLSLGAVGSIMILVFLIIPFLSHFQLGISLVSVLMIVLGYLFFKLAYAFAMESSKKIYWLTILAFIILITVLSRKVFLSIQDFPSAHEMQDVKGEYKAARVLLNAILLMAGVPLLLSLLRQKIRLIYKN